jgi:hypothetical protein
VQDEEYKRLCQLLLEALSGAASATQRSFEKEKKESSNNGG